MKELADIITLARSRRVAQAALATVVRIEGSSYRRLGASMLIGANPSAGGGAQPGAAQPGDAQGGDSAQTGAVLRLGSVSGGCLERDVESHAQGVLASGQPRLITYDTRDDADVIFGTALGCGGLVEVFIERVDLLDPDGPVGHWAAAADRRATIAELTIVAAPADVPVTAAQRAWVTIDAPLGQATDAGAGAGNSARADASAAAAGGSPAAADIMSHLIAAAREPIRERRSAPVSHATTTGDVRAFVRIIEPPIRLVICGAGDDAQPLAQMASGLGWRVWVLDHRAGFAKRERFPAAERVEATIAGEAPTDFAPDARTVAVVMNHHYPSDRAWLAALAPLPLPYLGLLGARHRTARLLTECNLPPAGAGGLEQLYAPAGLDIGAEGAEAIALAMLAEIQAVLTGRHGGRLRDRTAAHSARLLS